MIKKYVGLFVCVALVLAGLNVSVKASDSCTVPCYPYTIYGSCYVTQQTAGATTSATPMTRVEVAATYLYVVNPTSLNPYFDSTGSSNGGDYSATVYYSISGDKQSYSINASHNVAGRTPTGYTDAYY